MFPSTAELPLCPRSGSCFGNTSGRNGCLLLEKHNHGAHGQDCCQMGKNTAVRWDPGTAGSAKVFMKGRRLPGSQVRREKDLLCPSTTSSAPLLWLCWRQDWLLRHLDAQIWRAAFGMLEAPPKQRHVTRCHQQRRRRRRRRDGWFMAPFTHGEQKALGCCKDIFEEPDPVSFLGPPWRLMPLGVWPTCKWRACQDGQSGTGGRSPNKCSEMSNPLKSST